MQDCAQRDRLIKQWHDAILAFAHCVSQLGVRKGSGDGFSKQYQETELARLHAEDARMMLELHRTEHDC
jgi:hypothetical protein